MSPVNQRLDQIEGRSNSATPGPWMADRNGVGTQQGNLLYVGDTPTPHADVAFIVYARQDVPDMVAALRAVLKLHRRSPHDRWVGFPRADRQEGYCMEDQETWPCATVRAAEETLGG
ncbi:hypothetical protein [Micrococcus sp.]|uniref:hypothetical protein n=1 Tax=Micrococcus sp. TaxID=1271 RepID=UPI0026DDAA0F|nr:hypothetical protein [Micrococcus sp.]MDO4240764.1 hypothetical protein [Micrococcus sp.]